MPDKQFELCKVCRLNHNQGKGHKYSTGHQGRLALILSKALVKIKDISFFLHNPAFLRDTDRPQNSFWCIFCEERICEDDSVFVCSNTIRHLASPSHVEVLKKFWYENGANVQKRQLYNIQNEELAKWEDACKALSAARASLMEFASGAVNNIPQASSSSIAPSSFVACHTQANTSDPLPMCKEGNGNLVMVAQGFYRTGLAGSCFAGTSASSPATQSLGSSQQQLSCSNAMQHHGLTCIKLPSLSCTEGNVHTGAPPPWLQAPGQEHTLVSNVEGTVPLSYSQQRRLNKLRNPKRVGAAWAEKRRAEMAREAAGEHLRMGLQANSSWLPNFGRVWQSGSRRETRKEFESERVIEQGSDATKKLKVYQPYISKKQRLEMNPKAAVPD